MSFETKNSEFQDRYSIISLPFGIWFIAGTASVFYCLFKGINLPSSEVLATIVISFFILIIGQLLSYKSEFTFSHEGITELRKSFLFYKKVIFYPVDQLRSVYINSVENHGSKHHFSFSLMKFIDW